MRKTLTLTLLVLTGTVLQLYAQDHLNFTALESEGYGVYAHQIGHSIPINVCGLDYAYYALTSAENSPFPGMKAANHLVSGGTGFTNFKSALTTHGYTLDQVEMKFTQMDLGLDQTPNDWFISNDVETRMYRGGTYTFTVDGHDLITGPMPDARIEIDYNNFGSCGDDVIYGHTMYTTATDASAGSPAGVQAVAAAILQDLGNAGFRMEFVGMQPAGQGVNGAIFEAQTGKIIKGPVFNNVFQSAQTAPGMNNQCMTANVSANSTGSGNWIHIEHNGDLVCSILDSESMGTINASIYVNTNAVRVTNAGVEYLDRNFEITVTNQPANLVRVRIYFKVAEWEAFLDANDNDGNDIEFISQARVTKFGNASCSNAVNSSGGDLLSILEWGTSASGDTYYIDVEVNSFSSFFLHGGSQAILPVELVYFSAAYEKSNVELKWMTANETENDRFDIQRSMDGYAWEKIASVTGAGTRQGWQHYAYYDDAVFPNNTYYYRLKQIDFDETYEYSGVATVKISGEEDYAVYPNPFHDVLYMEIPEKAELPVVLELVNGLGQRVLQQNYKQVGKHTINTSELTPGVYEVFYSNGNARRSAGKLIK